MTKHTTTKRDGGASRTDLPAWESIDLVQGTTVGRLCIIDGGYPLAFPINYRVVREAGRLAIVFRMNAESTLARYGGPASLEVDQVDTRRSDAWSVIMRGTLRRATERGDLPDTNPLVSDGRLHWAVLEVSATSGRRFTAVPSDDFTVEWQPQAAGR